MLGRSAAGLVKLSVPALAALLLAGCSQDPADPPATTVTVTPSTSAAPSPSATPPAPTVSATQAPAPSETPTAAPAPTPAPTVVAEPGVIPPCSDAALAVSAGPVEEVDTLRRVAISFTNTSSQVCGLVSYPTADLLGGPGTVLVHVAKRPANAAPRLTLQPGDAAGADVQSSTIDSTTGEKCGRTGTLAVTPPDNTQQRVLEVYLPICDATISAVG
ncbi:DUF4232 domain-containing protein [Mycolicibacterium sp. BiH015]|uniref:DUF4232 domain-containing protein n=1 Tax=Mycolicibacterium sp. BiH015 TaxID=3018808 RepID=UPI0022E0257D|nr:DUF4232 domain-containing protein [Mycolicibacterium sp. BiH015]MDA2892416.1 DUF4232 domain-containing protein [Mycolicibacterium sp. BiH015]